jgi:two-component system chemotaxis sensor kinase CheA
VPDALHTALVRGFVSEAEELCERVAREVLELEKDTEEVQDPKGRYDALARRLHTLKGSAGSIGLKDLSQLAHRMEDTILPFRIATGRVPREVVDALLRGLDLFMVRVRAHADGLPLADLDSVLRDGARLGGPTGGPRITQAIPGPDDDAEARSLRVDAQDIALLMVEVERLREVRLRLDERHREVERCLELLPSGGALHDVETAMSLVGIGRALRADAAETADVVEALESRVKAIGTQPIRAIVNPLHRAIRDLCRETGKEAELSIVGDDVSVDRRVLSSLKEILVQLVRNAVDHGIEKPDEREAMGKHRRGSLVIRIEQQGNLIFFEVADDGRGLDVARIRDAAIEQGLVRADEVEGLDARAVHQLIFNSGLSTRGVVTETSGRGLGMAVVRGQIQALHGRVDVESRANEGTRFVLTLPAPLGSTVVLVIRCAEQELAIPMMAVERVVAANKEIVASRPDGLTLSYGDETLRLTDLGAILAIRHPSLPFPGQPIVIVQSHGSRVALSVDDVIGDRDLAIRALPREVASVSAFQGASTTARGDVVLILSPDWLVSAQAKVGLTTALGRALVVDDSLTARALHRAMLEAGGYEVHAVSSAALAWARLKDGPYDIIVCDVAMDPVDGFAFVSRFREVIGTMNTPVILVSGQGAEGDEARAVAAGADAFLTKAACASGRLLAEVVRVVANRRSAA